MSHKCMPGNWPIVETNGQRPGQQERKAKTHTGWHQDLPRKTFKITKQAGKRK